MLDGVDAERQTAIARDGQAPCALAVGGQRVNLPSREGPEVLGVCNVIVLGEHLTQLVHGVGGHPAGAVLRVEPVEALVGEVPYFHWKTVACSLTLVNRKWAMPDCWQEGNFLYDPISL